MQTFSYCGHSSLGIGKMGLRLCKHIAVNYEKLKVKLNPNSTKAINKMVAKLVKILATY